jgi:hypothetical protein
MAGFVIIVRLEVDMNVTTHRSEDAMVFVTRNQSALRLGHAFQKEFVSFDEQPFLVAYPVWRQQCGSRSAVAVQ